MLFKARNWIYSTAVLTNVPNLDGIMIGPAVTWALNLIKSVNGLAGGLISYYRDIAGFIFANCYKFYKIPCYNIAHNFFSPRPFEFMSDTKVSILRGLNFKAHSHEFKIMNLTWKTLKWMLKNYLFRSQHSCILY